MLLTLIAVLVILFMISTPVAFAIAIACLVYILMAGVPLLTLAQKMVFGLNSFSLLAIPFFILTANLMSAAGLTDRIFRFAGNLVGHIRGGIAHANVVASIIFAGMSGAAMADVAGLGRIEIEAMEKEGFDVDFASAVTAASAAVGPIIPPSVAAVIYGATIGVSIGKLLIGGIIPGLMLGFFLLVLTYLIALKKRMKPKKRASFLKLWESFRQGLLALIAPLILIGGILSGIFTPTESAAIAAFYALILGVVVYRTVNLRTLIQVFLDSAVGTAMICFIVSASIVFGWVGTIERLPHLVGNTLPLLSQNPKIILLVINVFLLVIGCFVEMTPILIILPPILLPSLLKLGIDPIHFGVVMVFNITIGLFTPPFGMGMFILLGITGRTMISFTRQFLPYLMLLLAFLMLLTYVPILITFLPNVIM